MSKAGRNKSTSGKQNSLRIIAGKWRGRKLAFPESSELRPTSARIRETLFNWLQHEVVHCRCLDLFAGSGALGLEALSRDAPHVSFVEYQKTAARQIVNALEQFGAHNAEVFQCSAEAFVKDHGLANYQLIFVDPPYRKYGLPWLLEQLEPGLGSEQDCRVFFEHNLPVDENLLPANWQVEKSKKAGQVFFYLLRRRPV